MSRRRLLGSALGLAATGFVSAVCSDLIDVGEQPAGAVQASRERPLARPVTWPVPTTPADGLTTPTARTATRASATPPATTPATTPAPPARTSTARTQPAAEHTRSRPKPAHRHRYHQPVYSLEQYVRLTPGAKPFPSDAVMLTIDDGPSSIWTPKILRLLEKHDVRATFCTIGEQARAMPQLTRAVASQGHHLANHTFTHPLSLPGMSLRRIRHEIDRTQDAVATAAGVVPHLFRAPGGNWGPHVYRELSYHNLVPLDWDVDPRDWSLPGTAHIVRTMLAAGPGDILLCHDGGGDRSETYTALKTVIPQLKARGLRFVTLPTV